MKQLVYGSVYNMQTPIGYNLSKNLENTASIVVLCVVSSSHSCAEAPRPAIRRYTTSKSNVYV